MTAQRLIAYYNRISDGPDSIVRLRRFVLDLAMRGNVVPPATAWRSKPIEDCLEPLADGRFIHQGWSPQCETHPSPKENSRGVTAT